MSHQLYHLESRWHNFHILVYHGPYKCHLLGVASHLLSPQCMLFFVGGKIWCESPNGVGVSEMIPPCRFFGCLCTSSFCCSHPARCHAPSLGCTCPVRVKTCLSLCFSLMDPQQKLSSLCFFLVVLTFWNAIHQLRALTTIKHNVIRKHNDIMGINKTRVFEMGLTGLLEVAIFSPESLARNPDWFVRIPMRCDSWLATGC